jgi:phosphomannomutase
MLGHPDVMAYVQGVTDKLGDEGRVLIRPSGTEPLARVMIESPNAPKDAAVAASGLQQLLVKLAA